MFVEQQQRFRQELEATVANNAVAAMAGLTKRNLALWKEMQGAFFGASRDTHTGKAEKQGREASSRKNGSRARSGSRADDGSRTQKRRSR
jgi:hypothetical protein